MEQGVLQADPVLGVLTISCVKRSPAEEQPHNLFSRKSEVGSDKQGRGLCHIRNPNLFRVGRDLKAHPHVPLPFPHTNHEVLLVQLSAR